MSIVVTADPALLAIPNYANTADEAEVVLKRIRHWSRFCGSSGAINICQLSDTVEVLALGGYFPSAPNIKALLQLFGLEDIFSSEDIRKSINTILDRAKHLIEVRKVEVVAFDNETTEPDLSKFRSERSLYDSCIRSISSTICTRDSSGASFVTSGLPISSGAIYARCEVNSAQSNLSDLAAPFSIFGSAYLIHTVDCLVKQMGASALWRVSTNASQIHLAICARVAEMITRNGGGAISLSKVGRFKVGSDFYASLKDCHATGSGGHCEVVLDTCARIIVGQPKYSIDDFRKGRKRSSAVVKREFDGSVARRTHVTKGHEALRLMLWSSPDGIIEFANVGPKNQLEIHQGEANKAADYKWAD